MAVSKKRKTTKKVNTKRVAPALLISEFIMSIDYVDNFPEYLVYCKVYDSIRKQNIPIIGYIEPAYLAEDGIYIKCTDEDSKNPDYRRLYTTELYLSVKSMPVINRLVKAWIYTHADMADDGVYDEDKHGQYKLEYEGKYDIFKPKRYFKDKDIEEYMVWRHSYDKE